MAITTPEVDVTPTDDGNTQAQKPTPLPWFVRDGLKLIEAYPVYQSPDRQIKIVCPISKQEPVFSLPVVIDKDGVIVSQCLFTADDGSTVNDAVVSRK